MRWTDATATDSTNIINSQNYRLPTLEELRTIFIVYPEIWTSMIEEVKKILDREGRVHHLNVEAFWSSDSEIINTFQAKALYTDGGGIVIDSKNYPYFVFGVSKVQSNLIF
jgi:hypothetical protein